MKQPYEKPELEIIEFEIEEDITASVTDPGMGGIDL